MPHCPRARTSGAARLLATITWLVVFPFSAAADSPAIPEDFVIQTEDGKHVFVMLSAPSYQQTRICNERLKNIENFRRTSDYKTCLAEDNPKNEAGEPYPVSGLYRKGAGVKPEYEIDWYAFRVFLSKDGRFLVRMGPWARSFDTLAVAFYGDGRLLNQYPVSALVSDRDSVMHTVSHFFWLKSTSFDRERNRFSVKTVGNDVHEFDVTSGALISSRLVAPPAFSASVHTRQDGEMVVTNLRPCLTGFEFSRKKAEGGEPALIGFLKEKRGTTKPSNTSYLTVYAIPMSRIRFVESVPGRSGESATWRIHMKSENPILLSVSSDFMVLCGKKNGEDVKIPPEDIIRLQILGRAEGARRHTVKTGRLRNVSRTRDLFTPPSFS